jgi:hypothetical protein
MMKKSKTTQAIDGGAKMNVKKETLWAADSMTTRESTTLTKSPKNMLISSAGLSISPNNYRKYQAKSKIASQNKNT